MDGSQALSIQRILNPQHACKPSAPHINVLWLLASVLAPGIDGGGSVRVPAALCGVAALRPTVGRTSTSHCPPNAFSIMAFGVVAGCLADALLVYAAIANAGMHTCTVVFAR